MGKVWVSRPLPRGEEGGREGGCACRCSIFASTYPLLCVRHTHVRVCACIVCVIIMWRVTCAWWVSGWSETSTHLDTCQKRPPAMSAARGAGSAWLEILRGLGLGGRGPGRIVRTSGTYWDGRHGGCVSLCLCLCLSLFLFLPPRLPSSVGFVGRGESLLGPERTPGYRAVVSETRFSYAGES